MCFGDLRVGEKWFTMVEIEVNSRCNRRCGYCPNSKLSPPKVPEYMSDKTLERLIDELSRVSFNGRLSWHFYNEPLLHPNLTDIVKTVTVRLPAARQVLYTNGDFLSDAQYESLIEAGIARIIVTSHGRQTRPPRPNQTVLSPDDLVITNRGGTIGSLVQPLDTPCFAPSTMLIVTVTGDVLLCYEDARRSQVMGNILHGGLEDIWFSPAFWNMRRQLAFGDRRVTAICRICNNGAHTTDEVFDYVL